MKKLNLNDFKKFTISKVNQIKGGEATVLDGSTQDEILSNESSGRRMLIYGPNGVTESCEGRNGNFSASYCNQN